MWTELIKEFWQDIKIHRLRATLTIVAIAWGTLCVVLLLAFGEGLGNQLELGLRGGGNRIMVVSGGQTRLSFRGLAKGRPVRMVEEDVDLLKEALPGVAMISPQYRKNVTLTYKGTTVLTECEGVNPGFEEMRTMYPAAFGRFLNDLDITDRRQSLVLGPDIAKDLFKGEPAVGKAVIVDRLQYTVVGILQAKMQMGMNNGPDARRAIIPHTTFKTTYGNRYVNSIVIRPDDPSRQKAMKQGIYQVLGAKYQFDPEDERALGVWDFIENERVNQQVSMGMSLFLGSIGMLTLLIAGVGVANVMYVVVKERTREIGIRMAMGARRRYILAQFLSESLLISFIGGVIGLTLSAAIVYAVRTFVPVSYEGNVPSPAMFLARPILSVSIMLLTVGTLTLLGLLAGLFPARKAASVDPVVSLRYE